MKFTIEFEVDTTTKPDGGIAVSGKAKCGGRRYTAGTSATPEQLRGGLTDEVLCQKVAGKLASMACLRVRGEG
jgi:hypothetical protein